MVTSLAKGECSQRCEEAARWLTPSARRYQVRRLRVQIPVPATFLTYEISVNVYLHDQLGLKFVHYLRVGCTVCYPKFELKAFISLAPAVLPLALIAL